MRRLLLLTFVFAQWECKSAQARPPALQAGNKPAEVKVEQTDETPARPKSAPASAAANRQAPDTTPEKKTWPKVKNPLLNPYEAAAFFEHQAEEHRRFGLPRFAKSQKNKKYRNSVVMQRSGRRRLYDHNILLRALFAGHLHSAMYGDLAEQFAGGIFLDLGSAVLFGEGAETVRDLHEDESIREKLTIIASDINDPGSKKSMFVDQYRESDAQLPFPVVEIPRLMDRPEHFSRTLRLFMNNKGGIILRSTNSGPDLYYDTRQVEAHLRAAIQAFPERSILYLFNKYILYKPAARLDFLLIGEIDETIATNHKQATWEQIDWSTRTFTQAVRLNAQHIFFR